MLRLNTRHQLPQTDLRIQRATLDRAAYVPAQVHTNQRQARSNKGVTQVSIDIDSYRSQRVTGRRTMDDFTRSRGQRGISDVQAATSRHTQQGYARATNGAKRGDDIQSMYYNQLFADAEAVPVFHLDWTSGVDITVNPSQLVGDIDTGDVTARVETTPGADIRTTQGGVQTYISNEGFIRNWVSEDTYDIYA